MFEDPPFIGDWHRSTKLGSGGFGVVWLWQNAKSKEKIAVKKCHVSMGPNVAKQKERWEREVDYMINQIRHVNIVRGIKVKPATFLTELENYNPSGMPILVMEYCEGGDLRRQLNESKSCSGLAESDVRNVLHSLKSAVEHLHSMSITHRDIKPENVVIQLATDGRRIYKLTDLGYAKPLDMRSIEASLVGTMEYIAPELITTEKYSCSVDYWSLGIIGFEVVTGTRPFAPHLALAQWMLRVRDKKSDQIAITEDDDGNVVYSNQIFAENQVSRAFGRLLEEWFRLALEWNPKQRGHQFEFPNGKGKLVSFESGDAAVQAPVQVLKFFSKLDDILSSKILTIFVLTNHKTISMQVTADTTIDELHTFIEQETNIPREKCYIIVPLENLSTDIENFGHHRKPIDFYFDGYFDKPMIYVNAIGASDGAKGDGDTDETSAIIVDVPSSVRNVLMNHERKLKVHSLKKFACDTLHFVRKENEKYNTCLDGWYNYALQLNHDIEMCRKDVNKMTNLIYGLNGALELYGQTIYENKQKMEQQKCSPLESDPYAIWTQQHNKFVQNAQTLVNACEKIIIRYQSVYRRSRDAYQSDIVDKRATQDNFDIVNATKAFDAVRVQIMNKKFVEKPHFELFQCAYKCLKRRDQLLRSKEFVELQRSLNTIHVELNEIKKALAKAIVPAEKIKNELFEANRKFYGSIWSLVDAQPPNGQQCNGIDEVIKSNATSLPIPIIIPLKSDNGEPIALSHITQTYAKEPIEFKIGTSANVTDQHGNRIYCFGEGNDTRTLIDDNEQLRISMSGLMREIEEDLGTSSELWTTERTQSNVFQS